MSTKSKTSRKVISKKTRFEVFKRDAFICQYCGSHPPSVVLEPDHIDPVANGGANHIDNLVTSCFDCNRGKGARLLSSVPMSLADKAANIIEIEGQLSGYRKAIKSKIDRTDRDVLHIADELFEGLIHYGEYYDWMASIEKFNARLDLHVLVEAAKIARVKFPMLLERRFVYFCGICWNRIREL